MAEKEKQLKVGDRVYGSYGRKGTVVNLGRYGAVAVKLAVVGLRVESEHEDSCCVTIELSKEVADMEPQLEANFVEKAYKRVSKGARPDYIRFAKIPLNFKGAVLVSELKRDFEKLLEHKGIVSRE